MCELVIQNVFQSYITVLNVKFKMVTVNRILGQYRTDRLLVKSNCNCWALTIIVYMVSSTSFNDSAFIFFLENYVCSLL